MILRPMMSYSEIYEKYWRYGFWYEKIGAILLWIGNTITILGFVLILALVVARLFI